MRKEEVERSKEGRRGRRVTSLPEWSLWGGSKMHPKRPQKEAQKAPKSMPGGLWAAVGVPGGPWGGPG